MTDNISELEQCRQELAECKQRLLALEAIIQGTEFQSVMENLGDILRNFKFAKNLSEIEEQVAVVGETGNEKVKSSGIAPKSDTKQEDKVMTMKAWFTKRMNDEQDIVVPSKKLTFSNYILGCAPIQELLKEKHASLHDASMKKPKTHVAEYQRLRTICVWEYLKASGTKGLFGKLNDSYCKFKEEFNIQRQEERGDQVEVKPE